MKPTKQVKTMIQEVNTILKDSKLSFEKKYNDTPAANLFSYFSTLLIRANCYHGFNEFYEVEKDGKKYINLVGTKDIPQEERFIQFNIN